MSVNYTESLSFLSSENNENNNIKVEVKEEKGEINKNIMDAQLVIEGLKCRKYIIANNEERNLIESEHSSNYNSIKKEIRVFNENDKDNDLYSNYDYDSNKDDDAGDYENIDVNAYNQICSIIEYINQQNIINLKNLLLAKKNEELSYFKTNSFIKEGFYKIYNFLKNNTHINDQYSCFFTFKEVLNTIARIPLYLKIFAISKAQLNEDEIEFSQTCRSIIEEQMKKKKTMKNRQIHQKRKIKEQEKKKALGLDQLNTEIYTDNKDQLIGIKREREPEKEKEDIYNSAGLKIQDENEQNRRSLMLAFDDNSDKDSSFII